MSNRAEELRTEAARYLTLANNTVDLVTRAQFVRMAELCLELANREPLSLDPMLEIFNEQQMGTANPTQQQQQQIQPPKKDDQSPDEG